MQQPATSTRNGRNTCTVGKKLPFLGRLGQLVALSGFVNWTCNVYSLHLRLRESSSAPVETTITTTTTTAYNFTVAICVMVKDAEAYLEEWLDYHLMGMKFQNIYLYDNSDLFELKQWYENTRSHPVYSNVEVLHYPGNSYIEEEEDYIQSIINADCVKRFGTDKNGPQHDYMAIIDIDEFVVPQQPRPRPQHPAPKTYTEIRAILQDYLVPYGGALVLNWMLFGD